MQLVLVWSYCPSLPLLPSPPFSAIFLSIGGKKVLSMDDISPLYVHSRWLASHVREKQPPYMQITLAGQTMTKLSAQDLGDTLDLVEMGPASLFREAAQVGVVRLGGSSAQTHSASPPSESNHQDHEPADDVAVRDVPPAGRSLLGSRKHTVDYRTFLQKEFNPLLNEFERKRTCKK